MIECRDGPRFLLEAVQALVVKGERFRKNLHRYIAPQARVPRAVHLAHPARPQRREDFVRPEFATCGKHHLFSFGVQLRITVMGVTSVSAGEFTRTRCPSGDTSYPICPAVGPRS